MVGGWTAGVRHYRRSLIVRPYYLRSLAITLSPPRNDQYAWSNVLITAKDCPAVKYRNISRNKSFALACQPSSVNAYGV
ncbi:MAG: hypothetical protein LBI40_01580 [Treponema sp.]|nr:hypothetical protein [Treponema sp.]